MRSISQFSGEITISALTPQFWKWNMWTDVTSQSHIHCRTWCSISHNELMCVHTHTVSEYLLTVHSPYIYYFNIGNQNNKKYWTVPLFPQILIRLIDKSVPAIHDIFCLHGEEMRTSCLQPPRHICCHCITMWEMCSFDVFFWSFKRYLVINKSANQ
jgi:hypothetical protein